MTNPNKRVCIILTKDMQEGEETIKAGDRVMRTTRSFAEKLIATGNWAYCSKSKLKSFLNKDRKLAHNMRTLEMLENMSGKTFNEKRENGKIVVYVPTFKDIKPTPVKRLEKIFRLVELKMRMETKGKREVKTYKKSDKSRFRNELVEEFVSYPASPATAKTEREKRGNQRRVSVAGEKRLVVAF